MMKKLFLAAAFIFAVSAADAQDWAAGLRMGSGIQAVGQRTLNSGNYLEGRLGLGLFYENAITDMSLMHVWRMDYMNWTARGEWFFDLGAGAFMGGSQNYFAFGAQGMAKLGYQFDGAPLSLAFDWSPSIGPSMTFGDKSTGTFNFRGLANLGLSCVYHF